MKQHYVYRLWLEGKIQYIGRTVGIKARLSSHKRDKLFDYADYIPVDECDIGNVEMYFIGKELPPLNKGVNTSMAEKGVGLFKYKYSRIEFIPFNSSMGMDAPSEHVVEKANKLEVRNSSVGLSNSFLMATSILNSQTNIIFDLNIVDKVVYSYINNKVRSSKYYEYTIVDAQDSISSMIGVEREEIATAIRKLEDIGLIIATTEESECGTKTKYFSESLFCGKFKLFTRNHVTGMSADTNEDVEIVMKDSLVGSIYLFSS